MKNSNLNYAFNKCAYYAILIEKKKLEIALILTNTELPQP